MAASGERRPRCGPAPIASFDHDVSDESSPESKQTFQLPEIREDFGAGGAGGSAGGSGGGAHLCVGAGGEARARSHSTPGLGTPAAPRIDISRASSSSHHDSRDSSPELALFAGGGGGGGDAPDHLGFREDGALELRSSTEELAFLEPAPGEPAPPAPPPAAPAAAAPAPPDSRRHSRKDSQGSEAALLGIAGRSSRLSSIGSQCSAHSALSAYSRVSRLSVVSGASRSPSPHKMLLETSFCGPKPIETDPEICAAAVEEHLLEIAQKQTPAAATAAVGSPADAGSAGAGAAGGAPDARDRREVRTEVTLEARPARPAPPAAAEPPAVAITPADGKREKESRNRRARSRERRDRSEQPEVYNSRNRSKDVIRIKLKPDEEYDDDDDEEEEESSRPPAESGRKPDSLALAPRPARAPSAPAADRAARSPSPQPHLPSRKSSFCSLFKSKETIASPDSPSEALRRKKSLEGRSRSRSKSRDRSAPPSSAGKIRGSVLSLFKTPRKSATASPSGGSRATSPSPAAVPAAVPPPPSMRGLKYYEDARNGIIHIPLHTPPDEGAGGGARVHVEPAPREVVRPASAPCARASPAPPTARTVLPDGSIIIPLHSPTERDPPHDARRVTAVVEPPPRETHEAPRSVADERRESETEAPGRSTSTSPPEMKSPPPIGWNVGASRSPPGAGWRAEVVDPAPADASEPPRPRRKEQLVFSTHVGSTEQVFSTQFSITKTPSVTSEISESFPSLQEEVRGGVLRDTHITAETSEGSVRGAGSMASLAAAAAGRGGAASPAARDSSESEGSSEAGGGGAGGGTGGGAGGGATEAEARGLVVQESFEEELPYVPTTLPLERPRALPMLPVRERASHTHTTASVERPRSARGAGGAGSSGGAPPLAPPPPPAPASAPPAPHERLRIRLPRRASHTATTNTTTTPAAATAAATHVSRSRTRSIAGDGGGGVGVGVGAADSGRKSEWIDFSEVPERRRAARRIQTLPARDVTRSPPSPDATPAPPALAYVEPDQCRCECHRAASPAHSAHTAHSPPTPEQTRSGAVPAVEGAAQVVQVAQVAEACGRRRPFTADLRLRDDAPSPSPSPTS